MNTILLPSLELLTYNIDAQEDREFLSSLVLTLRISPRSSARHGTENKAGDSMKRTSERDRVLPQVASPFLQVPRCNSGGANDKFMRLQPSSKTPVSRSFPAGLEVEKKVRNELTQMDRHSMSP
jgi:hypothetical protein